MAPLSAVPLRLAGTVVREPVSGHRDSLDGWCGRTSKRTLDLVLSVLALLVLLPFMLLLVALIRVTSPGPALFRQQRLGRSGTTFTCLKFRTMHQDAEARLETLLRDPEVRREWETTQKLRQDPRITTIGTFLRRTSLDELPQLLNIVLGQMSLVGPRPIVGSRAFSAGEAQPISEPELYGLALCPVLSVRPGLTGLWQVSGRNDTTYRERVALDLRYVETRTLTLDVAICLRTVKVLLRSDKSGAY